MLKLSLQTRDLVEKIFPAEAQAEAIRILVEECADNLPFCDKSNEFDMERLRFAAIKVCSGDLSRLREAVDLAKIDWRDLLVWADFANSTQAHTHWARKICRRCEY
jgi:hypothetical protein